jgi:hypothetical protein
MTRLTEGGNHLLSKTRKVSHFGKRSALGFRLVVGTIEIAFVISVSKSQCAVAGFRPLPARIEDIDLIQFFISGVSRFPETLHPIRSTCYNLALDRADSSAT